jgi:hypothetical protein
MAILIWSLPCAAQPWSAGPRWAGPSAGDVRCEGPGGVLPSGVYWEDVGWYEQHLPCARPHFAVVSGVFGDAVSAQASLRASRPLAPTAAYPWVVHTREAGLDGDGIAVVLGLYAAIEDAQRFASRAHLQLVRVLPSREALARFEVGHGGTDPRPVPIVTHVASAAPVAAYATRDVSAFEAAWDDTYRGDQPASGHLRDYSAERTARLARAPIACRVDPDSVFVLGADSSEIPNVAARAWQPVRCGSQQAWVPLEATRTTAVIWTDRHGRARVTQVSLVECDSPTLTTWELHGDERSAPRHQSPGGC